MFVISCWVMNSHSGCVVMKPFQKSVKFALTAGLSLTFFSCGSGGSDDPVFKPVETVSESTETPI